MSPSTERVRELRRQLMDDFSRQIAKKNHAPLILMCTALNDRMEPTGEAHLYLATTIPDEWLISLFQQFIGAIRDERVNYHFSDLRETFTAMDLIEGLKGAGDFEERS